MGRQDAKIYRTVAELKTGSDSFIAMMEKTPLYPATLKRYAKWVGVSSQTICAMRKRIEPDDDGNSWSNEIARVERAIEEHEKRQERELKSFRPGMYTKKAVA